MPFKYLDSRIKDNYVRSELRRWSEYLRNGVPCRTVTVRSTAVAVTIITENVALTMSPELAVELRRQLSLVGSDKI